jgi:hypothetical protein
MISNKISAVLVIVLVVISCQKEYVNPYDTQDLPDDNIVQGEELNPTSIEGLHANIFGKTCANSGCHDGTFEPDFRTIESTYNTLVYQPIIKNDLQGTYEFRVLPGNVNQSQIIARLTYDIDGNSGVMPLVIEPDSDWPDKSEEYIQNVKDWIAGGAKDVLGNSPTIANGLPQMQGVIGKGTTWNGREDGGQGALRVPLSQTSLELYFAFSDDETAPNNFANNKIRFSLVRDGFEGVAELNLEVLSTPVQQDGYYGGQVNYYHKITINPHDYASLNEKVYFRVYVKDADNPVTEIPSDGGAFYIKDYFSFTIIE